MVNILFILFQLSVFFSVDRPIPFVLGYLISRCLAYKHILPAYGNKLAALNYILYGLVSVFVFDWIRLEPQSFQMLLFSKRELIILVWTLSSLLLLSSFDVKENEIKSVKTVNWWVGSLAILLLVNLPILRHMAETMGPHAPFFIKPQIKFLMLALPVVELSRRLSFSSMTIPVVLFQISSCWMFICESRFFAAITLINIAVLLTFSGLLSGQFYKRIASLVQAGFIFVFSVVFTLMPFIMPWLQFDRWWSSFFYTVTSSRSIDTWALNLWHPRVINLSAYLPHWTLPHDPLMFLSNEYRGSLFATGGLIAAKSRDSLYHLFQAHSVPLQIATAVSQNSNSLFRELALLCPSLVLCVLIVMAIKYFYTGNQMGELQEGIYSSTLLYGLVYLTTESVDVKYMMPLVLILPVIQACLPGSQQATLDINTPFLTLIKLLKSPIMLLIPFLVMLVLVVLLQIPSA